jgi:hypothetical protein
MGVKILKNIKYKKTNKEVKCICKEEISTKLMCMSDYVGKIIKRRIIIDKNSL